MKDKPGDLGRPIRVVLFCGGPTLEYGLKKFIARLETHPEIEFLGGFCQSQSQSIIAVATDLWHRRRFLAIPLLLILIGQVAGRYLFHTRTEIQLNKKLASIAGRMHYVSDIHADEVLSKARDMAPDLGLIYGSPILKPKLFEIPYFGTLGIHHGKLPQYRGKKTTFWAMYNGEKTAGVTIQKVNAGLDTGEIVKHGEVVIDNRSQRSVWNELESLGLDLYVEAILAVKKGEAQYHPQSGKKGKLYSDPKIRDIIDFYLKRVVKRLKS